MSAATDVPWQRLDRRMIWVDAIRSLLSLTPAGLAVTVFGVEPSLGTMWPVLLVGVVGVSQAAGDALRWVKTRYRITDEHVERRTGLLVRKHRSIRRDRIRSVDTSARLRHRLAGLRLVTIGAGQQQAAGEALSLDAVSRAEAERLHRDLLASRSTVESVTVEPATVERAAAVAAAGMPPERELARFRWSWMLYNVFSVWAYLAAAGVLWALTWLTSTFGLDLVGFVAGLLDWQRLGLVWSVVLGLLVVGAFGAGVLAVSFVTEHWNFRLVRVARPDGTVLRTSQGLFKTRAVDRDDRRLRGLEISEPLLWRWMGMADTNVIATGLKVWSLTPATTILPRGPISVARPVAAAVLGADPSPLAAPLRRHPRAALRRRRVRAVLATAATAGLLAWLTATVDAVPGWLPLAGLGLLPPALVAAEVAYRSLGHALTGDHLVVRCGLVSRATRALQARAVVGWHLRQSVLQRRLGLASVAATTAAGYGAYWALDLAADEAVRFADQAVPGLLTPFLAPREPDEPA